MRRLAWSLLFAGCSAEVGADSQPDVAWEVHVGTDCMPGATSCVSRATFSSRADDGTWVETPCDGGWMCIGGACSPTACATPGERSCGEDGKTPLECDLDLQWHELSTCTAIQICDAGYCLEPVCAAAGRTCVGANVQQCAAGEAPVLIACGDGGCEDGSCQTPSGQPTTCSSDSHCASTDYCKDLQCVPMGLDCGGCNAGQTCDFSGMTPQCVDASGSCSTWQQFARVSGLQVLPSSPQCALPVKGATNGFFALMQNFDSNLGKPSDDANAAIAQAIQDGSLRYLLAIAELPGSPTELAWLVERTGAPCTVEPGTMDYAYAGPACKAAGGFAALELANGALEADGGHDLTLLMPGYGAMNLPLQAAQLSGVFAGTWQSLAGATLCGLVPRNAILASLLRQPDADFASSYWYSKQMVFSMAQGIVHADVTAADLPPALAATTPGACDPGPRFGQRCMADADCGTGVTCAREWLSFAAKVDLTPATCGGVSW